MYFQHKMHKLSLPLLAVLSLSCLYQVKLLKLKNKWYIRKKFLWYFLWNNHYHYTDTHHRSMALCTISVLALPILRAQQLRSWWWDTRRLAWLHMEFIFVNMQEHSYLKILKLPSGKCYLKRHELNYIIYLTLYFKKNNHGVLF